MKQQIVFIHGGNAFTRYEDFIAYLKTSELRDLPGMEPLKKWSITLAEGMGAEYEVFMPSMPNSKNAKYLEWSIWFERYLVHLHDGVILIGWSLGGYFLTKYLSENTMPVRVKSLYLLAAPFENDDFGGEDGGDFAFDPADLPRLAKQVGGVSILHSTDDPIVPYAHAEKYKAALPNAELITFTDKNHFLIPEFPELVEHIKKL